MGFFDPFGGAADVGELKSDLSDITDIETKTETYNIEQSVIKINNYLYILLILYSLIWTTVNSNSLIGIALHIKNLLKP